MLLPQILMIVFKYYTTEQKNFNKGIVETWTNSQYIYKQPFCYDALLFLSHLRNS